MYHENIQKYVLLFQILLSFDNTIVKPNVGLFLIDFLEFG